MTVPIRELGRAQHFLSQGDVRGAIEIYKILLEERPDDMRMQERFAALLREDGQLDAAQLLYRMIARHWEDEGFYLRAITSYRMLSELAPGDLNALRHLAELYAALHLSEPAVTLYRRLADIFAAQHNIKRRLAMLERIVTLRSDDVDERLLYATELEQHGRINDANQQLLAALHACLNAQDWTRYVTLAHRYLARVPKDDMVREELMLAERRLEERSASASEEVSAMAAVKSAARAGEERTLPTRRAHAATLADEQDASEEMLLRDLASMDAQRQSVDALPPIGVLGKFAMRPFGPSSEVLLTASGHVVAAAIRARKRGDIDLALALLEDEGSAQYPHASAFERGVALIEKGQWGAAMSVFADLMDADLAAVDRALVAYHLGVVAEVTHDVMLVNVCFARVETLCPGEAPDVPARLERML